jgi:hypothetical protein
MPLPKSAQRSQLSPLTAAPPRPPVVGGRSLTFPMERQKQTLWCWSATAVSVHRFMNGPRNWTQCQLASAHLGVEGCCQDGSSDECNQEARLHEVLKRTGNLTYWRGTPTTVERVMAEIDAGRPVACRVEWTSRRGHFVVLDGYERRDGVTTVTVKDPWRRASWTRPFESFKTRYLNRGKWTHTYFTKA